jgi:archaellum component FlaC
VKKEYTSMSRPQLAAEVKRLKDRLEDMEDTFEFNLANTSAHISGELVEEHERELEALRTEIAELERSLTDSGVDETRRG